MRKVNTKKADFGRSQPLIPFEKGTTPRIGMKNKEA